MKQGRFLIKAFSTPFDSTPAVVHPKVAATHFHCHRLNSRDVLLHKRQHNPQKKLPCILPKFAGYFFHNLLFTSFHTCRMEFASLVKIVTWFTSVLY